MFNANNWDAFAGAEIPETISNTTDDNINEEERTEMNQTNTITSAPSMAITGSLIDSVDIKRVNEVMQKIATMQAVIQKALVESRDYGKIPGAGDKPTLLKPGAEKINMMFGLQPDYQFLDRTVDFERGFYSFEIKCTLVQQSSGITVSQGVGCCNSKEKKYRYRTMSEAQLTEAGLVPEQGIQTVDRYGRTKYRVDNPDTADFANTILKMAKKRAYIDATLQVAALSDLFTQDLEDMAGLFRDETTQTMTPKEAAAITLSFGKHKGESLGALYKSGEDGRSYLAWLLNSDQTDAVIKKAIQIMNDAVTKYNANNNGGNENA